MKKMHLFSPEEICELFRAEPAPPEAAEYRSLEELLEQYDHNGETTADSKKSKKIPSLQIRDGNILETVKITAPS